MERTATAWTFGFVRQDHLFDARQVCGQRCTWCPWLLACPFSLFATGRSRLVSQRFHLGTGDVDIIQGEQQLVIAQLFRLLAECRAPDLVEDMLHPRFALEARNDHRLERGDIVRKVGGSG